VCVTRVYAFHAISGSLLRRERLTGRGIQRRKEMWDACNGCTEPPYLVLPVCIRSAVRRELPFVVYDCSAVGLALGQPTTLFGAASHSITNFYRIDPNRWAGVSRTLLSGTIAKNGYCVQYATLAILLSCQWQYNQAYAKSSA